MRIYPESSALTVRQRIEKAFAQKRKHDAWVSVHNNGSSDGEIIGFFLSDWNSLLDDFKSLEELDFRLDTEMKRVGSLSLGINYKRPYTS